MKAVEQFCGQKNGYSRSITLRNKLVPVGKTQENLDKLKILENDEKRSDSYVQVKVLIDDFHRAFIQNVLSKVSFPWGPLFDQLDLYQKCTDKQKKKSEKKILEDIQKAARKKIAEAFSKNSDYDKLFKDGLFKELLPEFIKGAKPEEITDKQNALKVFDRFSTYFTGFHENRRNMYSAEEQSTAISYRIVNENFPKFYANIKLFEKLEKDFPDIITETEKSLEKFLNGKRLKEIFSPESFNDVLTQTGIDFYNTIIGGVAGEAESTKIQGLNEKINLARQQLPDAERNKLRGKMVMLFKQILSDRETASFIPVGFEDSEEVYDTIQKFKKETYDSVVSTIKEIFNSENDYNLEEIYVPAKELTAFSLSMFGNWSILNDGLFEIEVENAGKKLTDKKIEELRKQISKRDYSLCNLQAAYEKWTKVNNVSAEKNVVSYFNLADLRIDEKTKEKDFVDIILQLEKAYSAIDFDSKKNLQTEKDAAAPIKEFLDEVQNLYHYLKLVDYRGDEQKDSTFYSKLDEILTKLSEIIPLYNKVRNFVTKKVGEVKKIKLNFDCPTLANGWDENKESANDAVLLRKDGKYYLGIFNPNDKPKFESEENPEEACYEKMVYKLLPGPNKMLPKVFFSTKGQETFLPPKDILIGYDEGRHKKGDKFDKEFMYKLIDWFKDAINRHEDWKKFGFKFSDTHSYEDMSGFYKEVELQGYKISFTKISDSKINSLIDSGKLFLFQIYNKDFAEKATGKKNMHTLYWENLFSEENLKDVCLKLNGEAELFYRPANKNIKDVKHEKGSILVNRTTSDGKSIPEEIYQEIYQLKNKMCDSISEEAQKLLDSGTVVCKEATHTITKDKHFTEDTYLFHCPITMNFKAPDFKPREFHDKIMEVLKNNPDVKVIGLDRGERHLIYLSLINQKGEIELQKTLNLVEQVRNDKTVYVNYQEKLVQKEGDRDKARKNWQTIGNIKELKEGYLSNVVHEIAKFMVENNAIVVMEDLNFGFKRGRFAVERQVYQKFENMLIEKLNYLVFKNKTVTEPGGVLNAYQLTDKSANVSDVYRQCGWLFYIPAAYTSKIDPKTGFANLFNTAGLTNVEKKKDFFDKFDGIRYDSKEDCFVFSVDYSKFGDNADFNKKWEIYTRGERVIYSRKENKTFTVNPTENLKKKFDEFGVNWNNEENFIDSLQTVQAEKGNAPFFDELLRSFTTTLQMRNSIPNSSKAEDDYLISPVKAEDGNFFDTRIEAAKGKDKNGNWISKLPVDSDANGAYHIALKGLFLLKNDFNRDEKGVIQNIKNSDWFEFVQEKEYLQ